LRLCFLAHSRRVATLAGDMAPCGCRGTVDAAHMLDYGNVA
jgi:hypothetical protein